MSTMPPEPPFGIVGMGLLGGSIARALGRSFPEARLVGVEPDPKARAQALADRVVAEALEAPGLALTRCNLVFLCVPLGALRTLLPALELHLGKEAILTDVTGVKGAVDALVAERLPRARFVGGHPMAGGEQGGFAKSRADLFVGRPVALCPRPGEESLATIVGTVWAALGARPVVVSAEEHDRIVAATSHLPYLAAVALARVVANADGAERLAGRGLSDAMRFAGFAPEVMAPVVAKNPFAPAVARVLADELRRLADLAESDPEKLEAAAAEARTARSKVFGE